MNPGSILVVDDNKNVLSALRILLENYFASVHLLNNPNQLPSKLKECSPDVVVLDMNFSAGINTGTAFADIDLAVRALKEGASDFAVGFEDSKHLKKTATEAFETINTTAKGLSAFMGEHTKKCY